MAAVVAVVVVVVVAVVVIVVVVIFLVRHGVVCPRRTTHEERVLSTAPFALCKLAGLLGRNGLLPAESFFREVRANRGAHLGSHSSVRERVQALPTLLWFHGELGLSFDQMYQVRRKKVRRERERARTKEKERKIETEEERCTQRERKIAPTEQTT